MDIPKPKLLEQVTASLRVRHYSYRTEMGALEVTAFLSHLATQRGVAWRGVAWRISLPAESGQSCRVVSYRHILEIELPWLDEVIHTAQKWLGRADVRTAMIHPQPLNHYGCGVLSSLDRR